MDKAEAIRNYTRRLCNPKRQYANWYLSYRLGMLGEDLWPGILLQMENELFIDWEFTWVWPLLLPARTACWLWSKRKDGAKVRIGLEFILLSQ